MAGYIHVYFSDEIYQKLKPLIQQRKVSQFVSRLIEKELEKQEKENINKEEIYRRDMRLANQDPERKQEIKFWDKIQVKDNVKLNNDDEWDWN